MPNPSRILVIGAGASLAEAIGLKLSEEAYPPLVSNFAKKLWSEFNPHPILDTFLASLGHQARDRDGRDLFYKLEAEGLTDVEHFFEFAWRHRKKKWEPQKSSDPKNPDSLPKDYKYGFQMNSAGRNAITIGGGKPLQSWENLIYHGIGDPMQLIQIVGFFENGKGWKPLNVAQAASAKLQAGDVVVNLNYDPLFEIGLNQKGVKFHYATTALSEGAISVFKPHGTLNMAVSEDGKKHVFGEPEALAAPPPAGWRSFLGILPPRFNKAYKEHPLAHAMMSTLKGLESSVVTFWGVGLANSDVDMLDLYTSWMPHTNTVEVVNPDPEIAEKFRDSLKCKVQHFDSHEAWVKVN